MAFIKLKRYKGDWRGLYHVSSRILSWGRRSTSRNSFCRFTLAWYVTFSEQNKFLIYSLDTSLRDLVERILPLGTYYTAISSFIEHRSHLDYGLVNHALCAAVRDMLKVRICVILLSLIPVWQLYLGLPNPSLSTRTCLQLFAPILSPKTLVLCSSNDTYFITNISTHSWVEKHQP